MSGQCSSSVHDCDEAFPPLFGFAFHLRAVVLPHSDAVGFGLCWSAWLSDLLTGRCCFFTLDSSFLAWLKGEPSTVFLLLCLRDVVTLWGHECLLSLLIANVGFH